MVLEPRRRIDQVVALGAYTIQMSGVSSYRPSPAEPLPAETLARLHAEFVADMRTVAPDAERAGVSIMLKPHSGDTAPRALQGSSTYSKFPTAGRLRTLQSRPLTKSDRG